jgi:sugar phosphate isomerase/epimerase
VKADQIALQMYTLRSHTAQDMAGTLRQVAAMGYPAVELAGYGGLSVAELGAVLRETGLRAMGAHVGFTQFESRAAEVIAELRTLGCEYAVIPSMPIEYREDADKARRAVEQFNDWGALCRDAGLRFAYHNHHFEFTPLGDGTLYDIIVNETDPATVDLEVDAFWAHYAGVSPVAVIERLGQRASVIHLKDMAPGEHRTDAPVGAGIIGWDDILAAGRAVGARWYIVEQDHPQNPLADVETSLRYLQGVAQ